jgi:hypothetical protein
MDDSTHSDVPAVFSRVQRKIAQWREGHRPRGRIPEALWLEAAELACAHGINRTARALRLDYYSLKKRAADAAAPSGEPAPEFVELLPGGMPAGRPECLIEVEDAGGAKLRIRLQGGDLPEVAALVRVFREGRS